MLVNNTDYGLRVYQRQSEGETLRAHALREQAEPSLTQTILLRTTRGVKIVLAPSLQH